MTPPPSQLWRAFPWDPTAAEGERFSATWVFPGAGRGRFDLQGDPGGTLYAAETEEHAVAEMIQHYRGQHLEDADLRIGGHPLALVAVGLSERIREAILDLCDPEVLVQLGIRPDETASGERRVTQAIASTIHAAGHPGFRWWSALLGDWHTVVLVRDRISGALEYGRPVALGLEHRAVREAARMLGIPLK